MINQGWKIQLVNNPAKLGSDLYVFYRRYDGKTIILKQDGSEEIVDEYGSVSAPTMHLLPEMLQALADALRDEGIKPKEASKTEGLLEAQSKHLEDLRKLLKLK